MPGRNIYKVYSEEAYYHIYNRGANKQLTFMDKQDYEVFLGLLKRYLGDSEELRSNRQPQTNLRDEIELLAYCLMPNHFHLFVYQHSIDGMTRLLKSVTTSYVMYFNKRHAHSGPLFQQRYRAVMITSDKQLLHASRYIHMNPKDYLNWEWSSLGYYLGRRKASWLRPERILDLHATSDAYLLFLEEYKNRRDQLAEAKQYLADA